MKQNKEILIIELLNDQFPRKRIKAKPTDKRFCPGIIIPSYFLNSENKHLKLRTPSEFKLAHTLLNKILKRIFDFDDEIINSTLNKFLGQ